jgi:hypothetical protein
LPTLAGAKIMRPDCQQICQTGWSLFVQSRHFRLCAKARSLAESLSSVACRRNPAE